MAQNLENLKEPQQRSSANLFETVSKELMLMLARNMDFAPSPEELPKVAKVLASDLIASGITDAEIVRKALQTIGRTYEKWPSTALVISLCRPKQEPLAHKMLAHEERKNYTPEEVKRFSGIIGQIKKKLGIEHDRELTDAEEENLLIEARQKMRESGEKHGLKDEQIAGL